MILAPEMIDLIVYDFDGVMTDNKVWLSEDGLESVVVNRSDGLAVEVLKGMGIRQLILSKERNKGVEARAKKLRIPVIQGVDNKREALSAFCARNQLSLDDIEAENIISIFPSDGFVNRPAITEVFAGLAAGMR